MGHPWISTTNQYYNPVDNPWATMGNPWATHDPQCYKLIGDLWATQGPGL